MWWRWVLFRTFVTNISQECDVSFQSFLHLQFLGNMWLHIYLCQIFVQNISVEYLYGIFLRNIYSGLQVVMNIYVELFHRIFLLNIWTSIQVIMNIYVKLLCLSFVIYLWHSIVYFFGIFKQIWYVVDSWIEYLIKVQAISTWESKESGHYICYKFIDGSLFNFDDASVNRVDMMEQYKINLIIYRRYDIDPYPWTIDLGFITHVE